MTAPTSSLPAFFLWLGSPLPQIARLSILSASEAGFDTVLFTDRPQTIPHPRIRIADYREISLPWSPHDVRLRGKDGPCFAAYSDLFRYAVLARNDGWWFDCDTVVMKDAEAFAALLQMDQIVFGFEDDATINGAVIGSTSKSGMTRLYDEAASFFPVLSRWGVVGPDLITRLITTSRLEAKVVPQAQFYPVHHNDIQQVFLPEHREALKAREGDWYCLSLWNEVLSRTGLKHLSPPRDSYLGDLLTRRPELGSITTDPTGMALFLADSIARMEALDSGKQALHTLWRKGRRRVLGERAAPNGQLS